jgi:hypothetical protein
VTEHLDPVAQFWETFDELLDLGKIHVEPLDPGVPNVVVIHLNDIYLEACRSGLPMRLPGFLVRKLKRPGRRRLLYAHRVNYPRDRIRRSWVANLGDSQ